MPISKLLEQNTALCRIEGISKKRLFQTLALIIAEHNHDLSVDAIFEGLMHRERLGTTGIGNGVAIPHCRLSGCTQLIAQLVTLESPIEYDALDGHPVDIIYVLLAPEEHHQAHLDALSAIARFLNDTTARFKLRKAESNAALQNIALQLSTAHDEIDYQMHS